MATTAGENRRSVTVKAPINIALVKYWGKEDERLIVPCNSSISATLDTDAVYTLTTVLLGGPAEQDSFELNGRSEEISERLRGCIDQMRRLARRHLPLSGAADLSLRIRSSNNFPTAAGLASSASGVSAVSFALYRLFQLEPFVTLRELTTVSRMASGSSCRSILGGFVMWHKGTVGEPSTSFAESIAPPLPDLRVLIYIFSAAPKSLSSREGMLRTKDTSALFRHRVQVVAPQHVMEVKTAIATLDYQRLFKAVMQDSNSLHACCLDSFPSFSYLSAQSWALMREVDEFNRQSNRILAAYSFDAGPNGFVFVREPDLRRWLEHCSLGPPVVTGMGNGVEEVDPDGTHTC